MDIGLLVQTSPGLHPDLLPEVQKCMDKSRCDTSEAQPVAQRKRRREEQRRVCLVSRVVERKVRVEDGGDVIRRASVVIGGPA